MASIQTPEDHESDFSSMHATLSVVFIKLFEHDSRLFQMAKPTEVFHNMSWEEQVSLLQSMQDVIRFYWISLATNPHPAPQTLSAIVSERLSQITGQK